MLVPGVAINADKFSDHVGNLLANWPRMAWALWYCSGETGSRVFPVLMESKPDPKLLFYRVSGRKTGSTFPGNTLTGRKTSGGLPESF